MAPHSKDDSDGEEGPSYSQVLKDAVGDSNGVPNAKTSISEPPPKYSNGTVSRRKGKQSSRNGHVESYAHKYEEGTALQKHVAYFDPDGDGIIWPWDTYRGCRNYGWGRLLSAIAAYIIHVGLSYFSLPHWLPDLRFPIYIDRVHKAKHGSSSLSYDNGGHFRSQMFEDFFEKYDRGDKGGLDKYDLARAVYGQRMVFDFFGITATVLEWFATYLLIWPKDGILRKDDIQGVFDGSTFQKHAEMTERKQ